MKLMQLMLSCFFYSEMEKLAFFVLMSTLKYKWHANTETPMLSQFGAE